jgi:hypothetical protein
MQKKKKKEEKRFHVFEIDSRANIVGLPGTPE